MGISPEQYKNLSKLLGNLTDRISTKEYMMDTNNAEIGLESALIVLNFVCIVLSIVFSTSITRWTLIVRELSLTIYSSVKIVKVFIIRPLLQNHKIVMSLILAEVIDGVEAMVSALQFCFTLILIQELFKSTCKMKVRREVLRHISLKSLVAIIFMLCITVAERGLPLALLGETYESRLISIATPATTIMIISTTIGSSYFGIRIKLSIESSRKWRNEHASQPKQSCVFLVRFVTVMFSFQTVLVIVHVAKIILFVWIRTISKRCFDKSSMMDPDVALSEAIHCDEETQILDSQTTLFIQETWCYLIEHLIIIFMIIRRKSVR